MSDEKHELKRELKAITSAIDAVKMLCGEDDELLADMIEGETNLHDFIAKCASRVALNEGYVKAISELITDHKLRKRRLDNSSKTIRHIMARAIDEADQKTINTGAFTVTKTDLQPDIIVTEESDIPSKYWKSKDPTLDKATLRKDALERQKAKAEIDNLNSVDARKDALDQLESDMPKIKGITLSNGDISVTIRKS